MLYRANTLKGYSLTNQAEEISVAKEFYFDNQYWSDQNMWGAYPFIMQDTDKWKEATNGENGWDPYLRSIHDVTGYPIQAIFE